jgi:hypothetical protein
MKKIIGTNTTTEASTSGDNNISSTQANLTYKSSGQPS